MLLEHTLRSFPFLLVDPQTMDLSWLPSVSGRWEVARNVRCVKQAYLLQCAASAMREGLGLMLLDVCGDLVENAMHTIPEDRWNDVVVVNLADQHGSCG